MNPRFMQLFDLALDKHLAAHAKQALWLFIGNGGEATRQSGGKNYCIIHFVRVKSLETGFGNCGILDEAVLAEQLKSRVDTSERKTRSRRDVTLSGARRGTQEVQNLKSCMG